MRSPVLSRLTTAVDPALFHRQARPPADAPLAIQWLGTAGFRVVAHGHHVWLDPHLSRHSLAELAMGPIAPIDDRIAAQVDVAHAVAVGHSHFDHALDAPAIARSHGARIYASHDTLQWCRGAGVPEAQLVQLRGAGERFDQGPFQIRAVPSDHSPFLLGRVPLPGPITAPFAAPARYTRWRVGEVFGLHLSTAAASVYHVGSAALRDAELREVRADVVLACTIGRHTTPHFTRRLVDALRPRLVIPCHWDQFWRPIDAPPRQIPGNDLAGFVAEVAACPGRPEVRVLPIGGWTSWDG